MYKRQGKKRIVAVGSVRQNGRRGDAARFLFNRKKHRKKNAYGQALCGLCGKFREFFQVMIDVCGKKEGKRGLGSIFPQTVGQLSEN